MKIPTKPYQLIDCFAQCWCQEYAGEVYEKSGKDYKYAKEYLELNEGDFQADNIIGRAKYFLNQNGIYAERRHQFSDFIRNIGSFGTLKPKKKSTAIPMTLICAECGQAYEQGKHMEHYKTHEAKR